jgi:hypothetical protein
VSIASLSIAIKLVKYFWDKEKAEKNIFGRWVVSKAIAYNSVIQQVISFNESGL